jgi:hypothetical protein
MAHQPHPFDDLQDSGIPMFGRNGTALSNEERAGIARKRGLCARCGIQTHTGNFIKKTVHNKDVHQGTCIRCNPDSIPQTVYADWQARNQPTPSSTQSRFRSTGLAVQYANSGRRGQGPGGGVSPGPPPRRGPPQTQPILHAEVTPVAPGGGRQGGNNQDYSRALSADQLGGSSGHGSRAIPKDQLGVGSSHQPRPRPTNNGPLPSSSRAISEPKATIQLQSTPSVVRAPIQIQATPSVARAPIQIQSTPAVARAPIRIHSAPSIDRPPIKIHSTPSVVRSPTQIQSTPSFVRSASSADDEDYRSLGDEDSFTLVKSINEYRDAPDQLKTTLHALRNLAEDQAGAMYELTDIMKLYRNNPRIMAVATGAVWGIASKNDDKRAEVAETGALEIILDSIRSGPIKDDVDMVQWALGSLAGLAQEEENKRIIAERGGIEAMVEVLKTHQRNAGVFEWACRALHSMVFESAGQDTVSYERNMITIEEASGIQVVIGAMKNHISESVAQWWAIKLLWRLQDRKDPTRCMKKMNDEDLISVCSKIMKARSTTPEVFQPAAELICALIAASGSASSFASGEDCITTCTRAMREFSTDANMQECCSNLLATLARGGSKYKREISESNEIISFINGLNNFQDNETLMESAMVLFWVLSNDAASFDFNCLDPITKLIEVAVNAHPENSNLNAAICGFLANVVISSNNVTVIPVDVVVRLSVNVSDTDVSTQAGRALSNICSRFPDIADRIVDSEHCTRLMEGLCNSDVSVQSSCCHILTLIALQSEEKCDLIFASGGMGTVAAALLTTNSVELAESLLELVSALVTSSSKKVMQLPNEAIQAVVAAMGQFPSIQQIACGTIRNAMLVTVPGFQSVNADGLVDVLTGIIDSPASSVDLVIAASGAIWAFVAKQPNQNANVVSQLFRSVLGLMGRHKGEGAPFHPAILTEAAGALASIMYLIRENPIHVPDSDIDLVVSILDLVIECDIENTILMERVLDIVQSFSILSKEILIQFGVIVVVIDCMAEHEQNEQIQQKGCAILALLASTENLQVNLSIAETDGIDMIVNALAVFSDNAEIQIDACRALSHLSIDHESRMLISSQGGLIWLVNAMNRFRDDTDLLEAACSALLNLSSDAEEQVLAASNVVETVIQVMTQQVGSAKLQEKGLGVLQNVSMRSKDAKRAIADAGGIDAVTVTIKEFMGSPTVLERAFTTMWSLAVLEENQIRIADAGGIGLVVNGMMANITYEKVQKQGCGCLCTLSSNSRNKTLIRDVGGVDSIVYAMWSHYNSDNLQVEACRALSSLAVNVQTNEVMIATEGEISAIMSAMRRFPNSERLQEHACVALRNFLLSADNAALVRNMREEVVALMNHASDRFPDRCSERANQVLVSLS